MRLSVPWVPPLPCVPIYRQVCPTQLLPLSAHCLGGTWLKHLLPLAAQPPFSHLLGHRCLYFPWRTNPSTLNYVINEGFTLYRAPGIGPDRLKPTGISCLPDTHRFMDGNMTQCRDANTPHPPPSLGVLGFETAKAVFATTRGITLWMEPSQGKQIWQIDLRMSLSAGPSWAWRQTSPGHCYVNKYFLKIIT